MKVRKNLQQNPDIKKSEASESDPPFIGRTSNKTLSMLFWADFIKIYDNGAILVNNKHIIMLLSFITPQTTEIMKRKQLGPYSQVHPHF